MYISLNWIKDFVDLEGINYNKLIQKFTLSTAEVEGYQIKGENVKGVFTAKIEKIDDIPNSKKLHLLKLSCGGKIVDVVCGAPNVKVGLIVPLALEGAIVSGVEIKPCLVAGILSNGMCCSAKELGFSDDNCGLYEFDPNTPLGVDIKTILDIDDFIFEIDNKSLTNRPDLWGHYGVAREIAALIDRPLKPYKIFDGKMGNEAYEIKIESAECFRYSSASITNITKNILPINMQIRLFYCGMRAINLLTDLTNYIMLELGQPMHAFDNKLVKNITVKNLEDSAKFVTLDGTPRLLERGTMVITSSNKPIAIAGVMGGIDSGINKETNSVLIESACFDAYKVRKTALSLALRTESSARYEKSLDPQMTKIALLRFIYLLKKIDSKVIISSKLLDEYVYKFPKKVIKISLDFINNFIGVEIPKNKIISILKGLEFNVSVNKNNVLEITAPSFRATKDIQGKADIVEEITRIYGYDNIPARSTSSLIEPINTNNSLDLEYDVKYALAQRFNLSEVHSYIWYDSLLKKELNINPSSMIKVVNSIQKDNDQIRSTIVPNMLKVVLDNKNYFDTVNVFEIGRVVKSLNKDKLVNETKTLSICLFNRGNLQKLLLELKEIVLYLFEIEICSPIKIVKANSATDYLSPANYYEVKSGNKNLGFIASIHPRVAQTIENKANICVCELDFSEIEKLVPNSVKFDKITKFPQTELDFNFEIDEKMLYSDIEDIATSIKSDLLYNVNLIDIYQRDGATTKSYTLRYKIWRNDRTLISEEIEEFHKAVIKTFSLNKINLKK